MALLDDIGTYLTSQNVVGGETGWTLAKGFEPPTPDKIVTIYELPGDEPDQTEGTKYDYPFFQTRVRGEEFGYEETRTKVQAVFNALNDADISGYVYVFARQSGPQSLGHDGLTRPILTLDFAVMKQR